ncbi:MAG: DNA-formamidopyrimidine glycosylase family protein [Candidatus Thorarchaeota archaeon]
MSIEMPEIKILAMQMNNLLVSKKIKDLQIKNYEKLQKIKFFNQDINEYGKLIGCSVRNITGRGTVIRISLTDSMNLLLAPEMGGELRYHETNDSLPKKFHLRIDFFDGTFFTVQLKGYGLVYAADDINLEKNYSYRRDFLQGVSPLEEEFTEDYLKKEVSTKDRSLKALMVGKEAIVVGFGNAGFQEIAYIAGLHPKKKSSTLTGKEKQALYRAIRKVTEARISKGGKDSFSDLFGTRGSHTPFIGGHLRDKNCPKCGTAIERLMFEGGPTYLCPSCQK